MMTLRINKRMISTLALLAVSSAQFACMANPYEIAYKLPEAMRVSVNIYDGQGQVVRELLHTAPRAAGDHLETWDGLTTQGAKATKGTYTWKILGTPGLTAEFVMDVGTSYMGGHAPGNHGGPNAVAADATGVYIGSPCAENTPMLIKQTQDGRRRLWERKQFEAWKGAMSLAVWKNRLAMLQAQDGKIYIVNPDTGANISDFPAAWDGDKGAEFYAYAMDLVGSNVAMCYTRHDTIRWYDAETGVLRATAAVPQPAGITVADDGTTFVATGASIVRLTADKPTPVAVVTADLVSPTFLDYDHQGKTLLVFDSGTQQVKRFSLAGKLLNTYGRKGGRKHGLYTPEMQRSFSIPTGLRADASGGFIVGEGNAAPRRVAEFDKAGQLRQEWYGGHRWDPWLAHDPENPNIVWMASNNDYLMRLVIDPATKTFKVHSTFKYVGLGNGLLQTGYAGEIWDVRKRQGITYLVRQGQPLAVLKVDEKAWTISASTIYSLPLHDGNVFSPWVPQYLRDWTPLPLSRGSNNGILWADENGDGKPQKTEITWSGESHYFQLGNSYTDAQFNCYRWVSRTYLEPKAGPKLLKYPVQGWTPAGAPIYGMMPNGEAVASFPDEIDTPHINGGWGSFVHYDGVTFYAAINYDSKEWGTAADAFVMRWDAKGKYLGRVGRGAGEKADARARASLPPGTIGAFRSIVGTTHGSIVLQDFNGGWGSGPAVNYVWDRDGLFVGSLFQNYAKGQTKEMFEITSDPIDGEIYTDPKSGEVRFYAQYENGAKWYRITGWNGWVRQQGKFAVN